MIQGLEVFSEYFKGFEDRYTLIGGVACYLNMEDADIDFRATKDLDIVLSTEALDAEFVQKFWNFVKEGGYEHQEKALVRNSSIASVNPVVRVFRTCWSYFQSSQKKFF